MYKTGTALALSAGLMAGCSAFESEPAHVYQVTEAQYLDGKEAAESTFEAVQDFWVSRGVPVGRVALRTLEGNDAVRCNPGVVARAVDTTPQYCTVAEEVVMPQTFIAAVYDKTEPGSIEYMPTENASIGVAVAHELGHVVQYATGEVSTVKEVVNAQPYV
ncbi:MAG TPA: hypothetical protein VK978_00260 [Candidatus Saccharimonadales bacterium]|nr:hypothetical protein [Candidatus Saccharimonadales bacterium]